MGNAEPGEAPRRPRLISSQAPGEPKKYYNQPSQPEPPTTNDAHAPEPVVHYVHVGLTFWQVVRAVVVAQLIFGGLTFVYWTVVVQPSVEDNINCEIANVNRALDGRSPRLCP